MSNKPDLTLINTAPITSLPKESAEEFKRWLLIDGLKPLVALRRLMEKYNCPKPDVSVPIDLLRYAYPSLDISRQGFRFCLVDSAYPNSDPRQFSDEDFDKGITEPLSLPLDW